METTAFPKLFRANGKSPNQITSYPDFEVLSMLIKACKWKWGCGVFQLHIQDWEARKQKKNKKKYHRQVGK